MLKKVELGWRWFQNMEVDKKTEGFNEHKFYSWKVINKDGKNMGSSIHNTESIQDSGLWEKNQMKCLDITNGK